MWERGELAAEMAKGFWFIRPADSELVLRKDTDGIWDELIRRAPRARVNFVSGAGSRCCNSDGRLQLTAVDAEPAGTHEREREGRK